MPAIRIPRLLSGLLVLACCLSLGIAAPRPPDRAAAAIRGQLIGAWRLVSIEYEGDHGREPDPYYGPDCTGLLVYDARGWMSVQIVSAHRASVEVPEDRLTAPLTPESAAARAHAFDSYYAYFGRWRYDAQRGSVIHEVSASLIPEEQGISYSQQVSLEDGRLILTNRGAGRSGLPLRRKIWARVQAE